MDQPASRYLIFFTKEKEEVVRGTKVLRRGRRRGRGGRGKPIREGRKGEVKDRSN